MHSRIVKFRKSFLYPVVACALMIYIYLKVTSSLSSKAAILLYNSNEELASDFVTNIANRDKKSILKFKQLIRDANKKQSIQNGNIDEMIFSLVIVIQVHDKIQYLKHLVNSLERAKGISEALIIFSHSYYNDDINSVIWNISFAKVMQIFYPYSVQLHPGVFPGNDQKTCNEVMACRRSNRRALLGQNKHHWWWKAAFVFDRVSAITTFNGTVLFLEENQYLTEDFIFIFKVLEGILNVSKPRCDLISLGSEEPSVSSYNVKNTSILLKPWSTTDNIGIAFNRHTWKIIRNRSDDFCHYNDNRWDKSLMFLASKTSLGKFYVLTVESSRIFRYNKCKNKTFCDVFEKIEQVHNFVRKVKNEFYPYQMHIIRSEIMEKIDEGNGDWADARDHELCRYFTNKIQELY